MNPTPPTIVRQFPRWGIVAILAVTLLGAAIRERFLDHPMRYDESYNFLHYASKSPGYIVSHYVPNNHILHTLLVHLSSRYFGEHPTALRLPAFVFGVLLIPATAWLGWLVSRRSSVAIFSALMICGSSAMIEYSTNARGYSLLSLLTILVLIQSIQILEALQQTRKAHGQRPVGPLHREPVLEKTGLSEANPADLDPRSWNREAVLESTGGLSEANPPAHGPRSRDREAVLGSSRGLSPDAIGTKPPDKRSPIDTTLKGSYRLSPTDKRLTVSRLSRIPFGFFHWIILGVTAALGLWTVPIMALPLAGISLLLMIHEIRSRRRIPTGAMTMFAVAGIGATLLYSPILIITGFSALTGASETAYDVLGKQVMSFSDMTIGAWQFWSRSAGLAWQILLALGLVAAVTGIKNQGQRAAILAATVGGAFLIAALAHAPLPSRTWLFALPLVIVISATGISELAYRPTARKLTRITATVALLFLAAMPMTRTPFQSRLCSEPGGLVEIEPAIQECQEYGIDRCSIVSPYNPARAYYLRQRGIDAIPTPDASRVDRVILVTTPTANLAQLWSADSTGFDRFAPPHPARIAPFGAVYLADRFDRAAAR